MRKQPGYWLHGRLVMRTIAMLAGVAWLFGIWIGMLVHKWLPELIPSAIILSLIVLAALLLFDKVGTWWTRNIEKGLDAETRVGQAIDYAVAAPGSAVAHGVTEIAKYGDIDHIVRTPARLWVVETKSGRVPKKEFRKVLAQIAANVAAVREWMPNYDVQGCLVLASGEVTAREEKGYDAKGETILVKDRDSLWRTLRKEARAKPATDNADVQKVWALGKQEK